METNSLLGLEVDGTFYKVPDAEWCTTLIILGGNLEKVEERVAFIEKSGRVLHNGEWVGSGMRSSDFGQCLENQEWCLSYLKSNGAIIKD